MFSATCDWFCTDGSHLARICGWTWGWFLPKQIDGRSGNFRGVNISKVGEISRTAEKIDKKKISAEKNNIFFNPHPMGGGGGGENFKVTRHQVLKSISGMQLPWAKPGSQREGG